MIEHLHVTTHLAQRRRYAAGVTSEIRAYVGTIVDPVSVCGANGRALERASRLTARSVLGVNYSLDPTIEKRRNTRLRSALDKLGPLRNDPDSSALRRLRKTDQALVIVGEGDALVSATSPESFASIAATWAFKPGHLVLSDELTAVVRGAREEWFSDSEAADTITIHRGKHVMLIIRLHGIAKHIAIAFQPLQRRATLRDEALRYDLTPREYEVLRLALGGFSAAEIALRLAIAETTAQVYLKRLLQKTSSRNRAQMVATVLGSRMSHDAEVQDVIGASPEPVAH